jgi:hypothetical protein
MTQPKTSAWPSAWASPTGCNLVDETRGWEAGGGGR